MVYTLTFRELRRIELSSLEVTSDSFLTPSSCCSGRHMNDRSLGRRPRAGSSLDSQSTLGGLPPSLVVFSGGTAFNSVAGVDACIHRSNQTPSCSMCV